MSSVEQTVSHSGNSHVTVIVDTTPIAYALILCFYGSGKLGPAEINAFLAKFTNAHNLQRITEPERAVRTSAKGQIARIHNKPIRYDYQIYPVHSKKL
ncbi:hypothetical protein [Paenibacillus ehimensis]|uniref:Uncharacterized protein n=1 Tax=Paenibacillus ehimensis TaxID=79264 RepID=A0ABT8V8J4_9BACL|nr:hypothetical protein [Paenibacillus ehimensis]MDO3676041.1 hypothetical protein [Paenibacillus ehimensis]MEC0213335.1 hypothetical protein [Paenibacillus ehimensis]